MGKDRDSTKKKNAGGGRGAAATAAAAEEEARRTTTSAPLQFEFCKVCRLNHNQGRKHRYFPSHAKAFSSLLSRFHRKLSDLRFFLRNPSLLRPEHAHLNRLWCVFCDSDVAELDSSFVCANAIHHLSGADHLKHLKEFLWKHGGGMDRVDSFRVSEADLIKWEKKCESLKASSQLLNGASDGSLHASAKDIHYQFTSKNSDTFENKASNYFDDSVSNVVMPLQSHTNESHLQSYWEAGRVSDASSVPSVGIPSLAGNMHHSEFNLQHTLITGNTLEHVAGSQPVLLGNNQRVGQSSNSHMDERTNSGNGWNIGHQANEFVEPSPPWQEINADDKISNEAKKRHSALSAETKKSQKLNPKRVGAAWAEKRRAELEMEKRGVFATTYDPKWLPNFGRVWQAGTRKESRKEFLMEVKKGAKSNQPETSVALQPYISKRMRLDSNVSDSTR